MQFFQSLMKLNETGNKSEKEDEKDKQNLSASYRRLLNASDFFEERISKLSPSELDLLFRKLTTQLVFDTHKAKTEFDV